MTTRIEISDEASELLPKIILPFCKTGGTLGVLVTRNANGEIDYFKSRPTCSSIPSGAQNLGSYQSFIYNIGNIFSFKVYYKMIDMTRMTYFYSDILAGLYPPNYLISLKDLASLYEEDIPEEIKGAVLEAACKLLEE